MDAMYKLPDQLMNDFYHELAHYRYSLIQEYYVFCISIVFFICREISFYTPINMNK